MNDNIVPVSRATQPPAPQNFCAYCGEVLNPAIYFCPRCATPYKDIETVISPAPVAILTEGELIEKKAPHLKNLFYAYVIVLVGCNICSVGLMNIFSHQTVLAVMTVALLITTVYFSVRHWPILASQLKRIGFSSGWAWVGLVALVPLLFINFAYSNLIDKMLEQSTADQFRPKPEMAMSLFMAVLLICVSPGILEEIACRGLIQHWLESAIKPFRAILLSSALFAVLHLGVFVSPAHLLISMPYLFLAGMLLGWVKWKTRSLYPSMLIHFLHNFAVVYYSQEFRDILR